MFLPEFPDIWGVGKGKEGRMGAGFDSIIRRNEGKEIWRAATNTDSAIFFFYLFNITFFVCILSSTPLKFSYPNSESNIYNRSSTFIIFPHLSWCFLALGLDVP